MKSSRRDPMASPPPRVGGTPTVAATCPRADRPVVSPVVIRWTNARDVGITKKVRGQPWGSRVLLLTRHTDRVRVPLPHRHAADESERTTGGFGQGGHSGSTA